WFCLFVFFFFFQAEDGIRDFHVTGVQTCALPILTHVEQASEVRSRALSAIERMPAADDERREIMTRFVERYDTRDARISWLALRSEERRVAKECRSEGGADH